MNHEHRRASSRAFAHLKPSAVDTSTWGNIESMLNWAGLGVQHLCMMWDIDAPSLTHAMYSTSSLTRLRKITETTEDTDGHRSKERSKYYYMHSFLHPDFTTAPSSDGGSVSIHAMAVSSRSEPMSSSSHGVCTAITATQRTTAGATIALRHRIVRGEKRASRGDTRRKHAISARSTSPTSMLCIARFTISGTSENRTPTAMQETSARVGTPVSFARA